MLILNIEIQIDFIGVITGYITILLFFILISNNSCCLNNCEGKISVESIILFLSSYTLITYLNFLSISQEKYGIINGFSHEIIPSSLYVSLNT